MVHRLVFKPYAEYSLRERVLVKGFVECYDAGAWVLSWAAFVLLPWLSTKQAWGWGQAMVAMWCVVEIAFALRVNIVASQAHSRRYEPTMDGDERVALARTLFGQLDDPLVLLNWAKVRSRTSLESVLAHCFLGKAPHELAGDELQQAEAIFAIFRTGDSNLARGACSKEDILLPSVQPLLYTTHALVSYVIPVAFDAWGWFQFHRWGFRWLDLPCGLGCWVYRPARETGTPILYFHGVGVGPVQMLPHIVSLLEKGRTLLLFNLPQIAFSLFKPIATDGEIVSAVDVLFQTLGLDTVSVVGHSFGTLVAMRLAISRPTYLANLTLLDPVCFMAWNANLIKRACYAAPTTFLHHLVRCAVSRDLSFSLATARNSYAPSFFQICDAFPCPTNIFLAKRDWAIDAPATFHYLHDRKARLRQDNVHIHMYDIDHLQFIFMPMLMDKINFTI